VSEILETNRLKFRQIESGDRELVERLYTDPRVTHGFGREPYTAKELNAKMHQLLVDWVFNGKREFVVSDRATNKAAGIGGLRPTTTPKVGEIGYVFLPEWWGMGFATEAIEAWTQWGFEKIGLAGIVADDVENPASVRALEKVGYSVVSSETEGGRTLNSLEIRQESWHARRAAG
jgi:RimJ/RimL family protein N-acetyltransferase